MASFKIVSPKHGTFTVLVDDEDMADVMMADTAWYIHRCEGGTFYVVRNVPHPSGKGRTTQRLHNFILGIEGVDHINGRGWDCRRENLRPATQSQNTQNRPARTGSRSGIRGIDWHKSRWRVRVMVDGRSVGVGSFSDLEIAAKAASDARLRLMPYTNETRSGLRLETNGHDESKP